MRTVKFRPKNFGRISFDLDEISPNQQILRLNNGRNSSNSEEIRPKFLRANLNCADSPGSPEKISTVWTKFTARNRISFKIICGESKYMDLTVATDRKQQYFLGYSKTIYRMIFLTPIKLSYSLKVFTRYKTHQT
jgi:hypothetical protein